MLNVSGVIATVQNCSNVLYTVQLTSTIGTDANLLILEFLIPSGLAISYSTVGPLFGSYVASMGYPAWVSGTGWINASSLQPVYPKPPTRYICPVDYPPGAQPNAFGAWCYTNLLSCVSGPNSCSTSNPCQLDLSICATGVAGSTRSSSSPAVYFCLGDIPSSALPNGGGRLCYDSAEHCLYGPNDCDMANPCVSDHTLCSTGLAAGTGNTFFCALDVPEGALANGAGQVSRPVLTRCLCMHVRPTTSHQDLSS